MKLTDNDLRVLRAIEQACEKYDGFAPHAARDWIAIRRLLREQLIECCNEWYDCATCPTMHETPAFKLTHWGMRELHERKKAAPACGAKGGCDEAE